jgi:hypothetical protein
MDFPGDIPMTGSDMRNFNTTGLALENLTLHSLKFFDLHGNPVSSSSSWIEKLKACLPWTRIQ